MHELRHPLTRGLRAPPSPIYCNIAPAAKCTRDACDPPSRPAPPRTTQGNTTHKRAGKPRHSAQSKHRLRSKVEWTDVHRYGASHDEVPDYTEPDTARLATLNIRGGGSDSKVTMLAPALQSDGLLSQATKYQVPDFLWLTELQNARDQHDDFAKRFLTPDTALYVTSHVALIVQRRFLGHQLRVRESQDGRVLQVLLEWHGQPTCFTGIYAPGFTTAQARQCFYNRLQVPVDIRTQAVLGDFNHTYGTPLDTNDPRADNAGLKQWQDFVLAHPLLGFTDSKMRDNADERWYTWQGTRQGHRSVSGPAWGLPSNHKRRLDRIELTGDTVQVPGSWATHRPWGGSTLDHALVTVEVVAPFQRPPPLPDPDVLRPMKLHILKMPEFKCECIGFISDIDGSPDADARDEMDLFLHRCREAHDKLLRAANKAQYGELKTALARVAADDDAIAADAAREDERVFTATGRRPANGATEKRWYREARDSLELHANDLHSEREILEADFSHLSAKSFFQQVNVRTNASTFPFQQPCAPTDDVQSLDPNMARTGYGGFQTASNITGWSGPTPCIPPPVSTTRITDQPTMLANTLLFYEWLFRERRWHAPSRARVLAAMAAGPVFDADTATKMGAKITPAEIELALSKLARGKAPGPNGVPSEFFIMLGSHISPFMADFANTVRDRGGFSEKQRQGKIVLLWKNKNKGDLTCYRPLTLLQRETSVIEMVITMRLAATLPSCIEIDQTGFLAKDGRRMHENIIKMQDALDYAKDKNIDACAISIDAVKAFDRVSRRLLYALYDILCGGAPGSDQPLTMWVKALMANQERRVLVNGELTAAFTLNSGIPQGAILSVISYTLFSESLARLLQHGDAAPCGTAAPPPGAQPVPTRGGPSSPTYLPPVGSRAHGIDVHGVVARAHGTDVPGDAKPASTAMGSCVHGTDVHGVGTRAHGADVQGDVQPASTAVGLGLRDWSWGCKPTPPTTTPPLPRRRAYTPFTGLKGIRTPSCTARLCTVRYADDIVLVLQPDEVAIALDICEIWNAASGMARNDTKTEGMWIGAQRLEHTPWRTTHPSQSPGDSSYASDPIPGSRITWLKPGSSLKVLGVYVGYAVSPSALWETIAAAMFSQFRLWQLARLGYLTRVLVCKVMVWSKAFFMASYIPPPEEIMSTLCAATRCFIQRGYLPKGASIHSLKSDFNINPLFNGDAVTRPKTEGGLAMWDPALHLQSILAKWVILLLEPQRSEQVGDTIVRWHTIGRYYINEYTGLSRGGVCKDTHRSAFALVDGKLTRPSVTNLILPRFWQQVLVAWHGARGIGCLASPTTAAEVASMSLWNNQLIRDGTTLPPRGWLECGLRYVRDIWDFTVGRDRSLPELRTRARLHGATVKQTHTVTAARVRACVWSLPRAWHDLMICDRAPEHGDLYAMRGACLCAHDDEYAMTQVWSAVVAPSEPLRWQRWSHLDYATDHAPHRERVRKGAGAAGVPPPLHPPTTSQRVLYTDGGCVRNAATRDAMQLAGAGCAVVNDARDASAGASVSIYCPVITDPGHPHFLGAMRGTNNTGELVGVGEALLWLRDYDNNHDDVLIYVDSTYAPAVVEARWGYKSNHDLISCIQSILVQVRATRNVTFKHVYGHSGDPWNDVADELATQGQDLDPLVRSSCRAARFSTSAPRTLLSHDPRTGGGNAVVPDPLLYASASLRCVAQHEEPALDALHRVTRTANGTPQGFSHTAYAQQVERVTWPVGGSHVPFCVRSVRKALATAARGPCGVMHVHASRLAVICPYDLRVRWCSMWREGWSAPWPTRVSDMWWKMASGGQFVSHQLRSYNPPEAFCRVCATFEDVAVFDTHLHLYYECPCQEPLWAWATRSLRKCGLTTPHAAAHMLYGAQVLTSTTNPGSDLRPHETRAANYIRAAVIEAFSTARTGTMTPGASGVHPGAAPGHARALLRGYIEVDWYAATRAHKRHTHLVHKPDGRARGARPTTITGFAHVWHKLARVRKKGRLEWRGPCRSRVRRVHDVVDVATPPPD